MIIDWNAADAVFRPVYAAAVTTARDFVAYPTHADAEIMLAYGKAVDAVCDADTARQVRTPEGEGFAFLHGPDLAVVREAVRLATALQAEAARPTPVLLPPDPIGDALWARDARP